MAATVGPHGGYGCAGLFISSHPCTAPPLAKQLAPPARFKTPPSFLKLHGTLCHSLETIRPSPNNQSEEISPSPVSQLQGHLAHKKVPPPRTLHGYLAHNKTPPPLGEP